MNTFLIDIYSLNHLSCIAFLLKIILFEISIENENVNVAWLLNICLLKKPGAFLAVSKTVETTFLTADSLARKEGYS